MPDLDVDAIERRLAAHQGDPGDVPEGCGYLEGQIPRLIAEVRELRRRINAATAFLDPGCEDGCAAGCLAQEAVRILGGVS